MTNIISGALGRSRTVILGLILILIAGAVSYVTIPKEDNPDITIPIIYVSMHHEGISPVDAERLLLKPMEKELRSIEGVKEMRSSSFLGGGNVVMEFEAGSDIDLALTDVREKVDIAKAELPDDADEPSVHEVNLSLFPILVVNLSGDVPERALLAIAKNLQDKLESIPNVLEAKLVGDRDELIEIVVDPLVLESYNLDANDIITAVGKSNLVVAAGSLDTGQGRFAIQVPGLFEDTTDILNMPVKVNGDAVVRVKDIGILRKTFKDTTEYARVNNKPALTMEISKRTGTNIIETIEQVRDVVNQQQTLWPESINVSYSQDQSTGIRTMLQDLQNNVLSAIILVMIVVVAALGFRSSILVGIAIPGSFLASIMILHAAGLTVNVVVLFSLILSVGMLVDGAIVVTEFADRKMSEGLHRREAYKQASLRMAWPIIASTATTLAAFAPLIFWPGIMGEFMKFMPITLIATLSASLVMALIVVPTIGGLIGKAGGAADKKSMENLAASEAGDLNAVSGFTGLYIKLMHLVLRIPGTIATLTFASLIGVIMLYSNYGKGVEFFPDIEPDNAVLQVRAQGNMSIDERDYLVRQVEQIVLDIQNEKHELHNIYVSTNAESTTSSEQPEDVIGNIQMEFTDWFNRRPADEILAEIRERTAVLGGISVEPRKEEKGPSSGKPIHIEIASTDPSLVYPWASKVANHLREANGFVDIEDGLPVPGIEWRIDVDRAQAAKFGADIALIGSYIRMVTNGMKLGSYRPDDSDEEIDLVVRLPRNNRNIEHLDQIKIQTNVGLIPISNFITRTAAPKVGVINRVDSQRVATVKSDIAPGILADDKVKELTAWMASQELDPRVTIQFKGENEDQQESQEFLVKAFGVALFMIAIILVTQFNSFYSAFLILSAVIMSTIGVLIGLLITDQPFGIVMSGIGVIALAGIVVNNNIVLIDTFDYVSTKFKDQKEAIIRTGAQRLRPVMLTTITTVLGLMPMVLATNIDLINRTVQVGAPSTQWWTQLATAIAFGLCFATILTLVITPCSLMVRVNSRNLVKRIKARFKKNDTPSEPPAAGPVSDDEKVIPAE
ncbi:acriflavin resistance protein [Kiloniella litopenaei]|uniref:Acriflavin resistance protein n=1 Tax=Kiloniella litopenaei TaxID=1549748 RepID=A0A0M2R4E2_9PROT|nr:efflux RND transporter permease subunit [Kiloniella litopenaei]KKJ76541.1 acriflavin resistance protein [Kiloniella litopenaei]